MRDPLAFEADPLANGLNLDAKYVPGSPVRIEVVALVGARHDPEGFEGISHFLEHAVTIGMEEKMDDAFAELGGTVDLGATDFNSTRYGFYVPCDHDTVARALDLIGDLLLVRPLVADVEEERAVVLAEHREAYRIKALFELERRAYEKVYHDSWHRHCVDPGGTREGMERITVKDLEAARAQFYCPCNIHVVAYGGIKQDDLVSLLEKSPFGAKCKGTPSSRLRPVANAAPPLEISYEFPKSRYLRERAEGGDYRTLARLPGSVDYAAVELFSKLLDRVLFRKVRVENGAYSSACDLTSHGDYYEIDLPYTSLSSRTFGNIERVVNKCIETVGEDEEEFLRVQRNAIKGAFTVDKTVADICEQAVDDVVLLERVRSLAEVQAAYKRVTMSDIRAIVESLAPDRRWTLISPP